MRLLNQRANHIGAMQAGEDSHRRLELLHRPLHLVGFAESDVWRIADHEIEIAKIILRENRGPSARTKVLARDDSVDRRHRSKNITLRKAYRSEEHTSELQSLRH